MGRLSLAGGNTAVLQPLQNPAMIPAATTLAQVDQLLLQRQ
jgi:hypothetical protein